MTSRKVKLFFLNFESARSTRKHSLLVQLMLGINEAEQKEAAYEFWKSGHYKQEFACTLEHPEVSDLDAAESFFHLMQNTDDTNWSKYLPDPATEPPRRSMMVGDILQVDQIFYLCAPVGFRILSLE